MTLWPNSTRQPTPQWTRLRSRRGSTPSGQSALHLNGAGQNTSPSMWSRKSRAGKVRSRLPVCRWTDAGFCAPAYTQDVRFGSLADMPCPGRHVCFTPESGHCNHDTEYWLRAKTGSRSLRDCDEVLYARDSFERMNVKATIDKVTDLAAVNETFLYY